MSFEGRERGRRRHRTDFQTFSTYTPSKCAKLREQKREKELAEYKAKVVANDEEE